MDSRWGDSHNHPQGGSTPPPPPQPPNDGASRRPTVGGGGGGRNKSPPDTPPPCEVSLPHRRISTSEKKSQKTPKNPRKSNKDENIIFFSKKCFFFCIFPDTAPSFWKLHRDFKGTENVFCVKHEDITVCIDITACIIDCRTKGTE